MSRSGYDPVIPQFTSVSLNWKSATLDGDVYAEPLVVGTDVIVATEANSLYELNAGTGQVIWHINFGSPVPASDLGCPGDIDPSGITSTPVIDVAGSTIYVVAFLESPSLHHELFAVDLGSGSVKFQVGVDPSSSNFPVNYQQQRGALALANGYVYVPYGGLDGDCGPYHGWLAATSTSGGGQLISYQVPTGRAGAIWGGGDGPAVDQSGDLFVATGNSDATSTFDYGDAVLKLSSATANPPLSLLDYFAPTNWAQLNSGDIDLGSTEPVPLSSSYLFQIGKEGVGYILDATNLGGIGSGVYNAQVCANGGGAYGGLAYDSPYLIVPCDNGLVALKVTLSSNPSFTVAWRGPNYLTGPPIIAGNAVWDVDAGDGSLYAFSLTSGQKLFHQTIGSVPTHFNSLSAGDGQIFVTANQQLLAYLPQQTGTGTMTVSYSLEGGGSPTAPVFHYVLNGVSKSLTLTTTATKVNVDGGSSWSVTPNPLTGSKASERWDSNQALSGTASTTTIVFAFYHQTLQTLSYAVKGGGAPTAPSFQSTQFGSSASVTLSTTPTGTWFDVDAAWTVTNPLGGSSSSERWFTSHATSGVINAASTLAFPYQHEYYLTMLASPSTDGTVAPKTGWHNAGSTVTIRATPKIGHTFTSWTGTGTGSFSGTSNPATITMDAAITETANFT